MSMEPFPLDPSTSLPILSKVTEVDSAAVDQLHA